MSTLKLKNGLFNEVKAELKFGNNRRPIFDNGSGSTQSKIPARSHNPGGKIPELGVNNFKQNDLNKTEFKLIVSMDNVPEDEGRKGVKVIPGVGKTILINSTEVEIYPHHIEVIDKTNDPRSNKFIVVIHYKMTTSTSTGEKIGDLDIDMDEDPKIIHPDEP